MSDWFWKKLSLFTGLAAIAVLSGLMIFMANVELKDLDLWLHLATGRVILLNQFVPAADIFSCTILGKPWINHEWLFQVIVATIFQWTGPEGLIDLRIFIISITFLLLVLLGYNKERPLIPLFALFLMAMVYQMRFTLRPDLFSLLFLVIYIRTLSMYLSHRQTLWFIFVLQVLWTNIHGFFVLGPLIIFLAFISEWLKRHTRLPYEWNQVARLTDGEYKLIQKIFIISVLACVINPFGIKGALYPLGVIFSVGGESKIFFEQIKELARPISWNTLFSFAKYPFFKLLMFLSFLSFLWNRKKIDISALFLWLFFLLFALSAVRNVVYFAIIAYCVILINTQNFSFENFSLIRFKNKKFYSIITITLHVFLIFWIFSFIEKLSVRGYFDFEANERKSEYRGVSQRNFPHQAVDFLATNAIEGNFLNDFNSGAYLIGRVSPRIKVFIDGRTEVYGADHFRTYQKIWNGDTELFNKSIEKYDLTGVFLNSTQMSIPNRIISYLYKHQDWQLVYFDYDAAIFLRDISLNKDWINTFKIDLEEREIPKIDLLRIGIRNVPSYQYVSRAEALLSVELLDQAEEEVNEALKISPYNVKSYKILGKIDLERENYIKAFENFRKAKLLDAGDLEIRYDLGRALYHLGRWDDAIKQCNRILVGYEKNYKALFLLSRINAKRGEYNKSLEYVKEAYRYASDEVRELLETAEILYDAQQYVEAKEVYQFVLKSDPNNEQAQDQLMKMKDES